MRKLGRMVRRVLTVVSLLLFVAVLAAWVRGYWSRDTCWAEHEVMNETGWCRTGWAVKWGGGEVGISHDIKYADADKARSAGKTPGMRWQRGFVHEFPKRIAGRYASDAEYLKSSGGIVSAWSHGGVVVGRAEARGPMFMSKRGLYLESHYLVFPCWMAAIVFGALPSWRCFVWWRGVRRRRLASREGRCPVCGYDLRASPQRCPECGTAVGGKLASK